MYSKSSTLDSRLLNNRFLNRGKYYLNKLISIKIYTITNITYKAFHAHNNMYRVINFQRFRHSAITPANFLGFEGLEGVHFMGCW